MKIYFLRHGETDWNQLEKIQGRIDNPLNERGRDQAKQAAHIYQNDMFTHAYASTLFRAVETARIILGERPINVEEDDRLIERDFGELEGQNHSAYYECEKNGVLPPSVETKEVIFTRVHAFFQEIVQRHEANDIILVIAHAHAIRTWAEKMFSQDFLFSTRLYNCQGIEIEYVDGKFFLRGITKKVEVEGA